MPLPCVEHIRVPPRDEFLSVTVGPVKFIHVPFCLTGRQSAECLVACKNHFDLVGNLRVLGDLRTDTVNRCFLRVHEEFFGEHLRRNGSRQHIPLGHVTENIADTDTVLDRRHRNLTVACRVREARERRRLARRVVWIVVLQDQLAHRLLSRTLRCHRRRAVIRIGGQDVPCHRILDVDLAGIRIDIQFIRTVCHAQAHIRIAVDLLLCVRIRLIQHNVEDTGRFAVGIIGVRFRIQDGQIVVCRERHQRQHHQPPEYHRKDEYTGY